MVQINASYTLQNKASELAAASLHVLQYCEALTINLKQIPKVLPGYLSFHFQTGLDFSTFPKVGRGDMYVITCHTITSHICKRYIEFSSIFTYQHTTNIHYIFLLPEGAIICNIRLQFSVFAERTTEALYSELHQKNLTDYFCKHLLHKQ